jgi:hypothetical protein
MVFCERARSWEAAGAMEAAVLVLPCVCVLWRKEASDGPGRAGWERTGTRGSGSGDAARARGGEVVRREGGRKGAPGDECAGGWERRR